MRETEGTVRAWFVAMGILAVCIGLAFLAAAGRAVPVAILQGAVAIGVTVLGVGYLIVGANLRDTLAEGAGGAHTLLVITLGLEVAGLVSLSASDIEAPHVIAVGGAIALTAYVRGQLRGLTAAAVDRINRVAPVARAVVPPGTIGSWAVRNESRS